jgi:hypothetical protein
VRELIEATVEAEAEEVADRRVERKRQEAVGEVQLAIPASRMGCLHCIVDAAVLKVVIAEMTVEVA